MITFYIKFDKPTAGYWDGGAKSGGEFRVDHIYSKRGNRRAIMSGTLGRGAKRHPGPDHEIKWGSWDLNFFFTAMSGRSWKEAKAIAMRKAKRLCGVPCKVEP